MLLLPLLLSAGLAIGQAPIAQNKFIEPGAAVIWSFDPPEPGLDEPGGWYHSLVNSEVYIDGALGSVSAPNALRLVADYRAFHWGAAGAAVVMAATPGMNYGLSAQIKADASNASTYLRARVYEEAPGGGPGATLAEFQITKASAGSGWRVWDAGSFTATTSGVIVEFVATDPLGKANGGAWLVDDVEVASVSEDDMKKWTGINAAITALKAITTAGSYNNDLGSRVYTRLFTPAEQREVKLPYVCMPIDQEAEKIEYEGFQFQSTWRLTGHAFFADNSESDPLNSTGATSAAKFRDDLIRAFMADPDLGNTVNNCEVTNIETSAGIVDDGVSEVIFTVEFMQYGGAADLAAS